VSELEKLRDHLNNYKEKETDEAILDDAESLIITTQAKVVVDKWKEDLIFK
jgi:hypothetical protein